MTTGAQLTTSMAGNGTTALQELGSTTREGRVKMGPRDVCTKTRAMELVIILVHLHSAEVLGIAALNDNL